MSRAGTIVAVLVGLGASRAAIAYAEGSSCSGDSDSGSSSSSSSSSGSSDSSSDSSSSSSSPPVPACIETSDVHGYRQCTSFGRWSSRHAPPIFFELGGTMRTFASPLGTRTEHLKHEQESFSYRVVGPAAEPSAPLDTAVVATLRVGMHFRYGIYGALEGEVGGLTTNTASAEMTSTGERGTPTITPGGVAVGSGLGVLGIRTRLGSVSLGAEAAGGFRFLTYSYDSSYGACRQTDSVTTSMTVLEARARAAYWFNPFASVGATYGKSLVDEAWLAGVFVNWNVRAFGN